MQKALPKGWKMVRVGKVIENVSLTGKKLKQLAYQKKGKIPIIDQGQALIAGYTDKNNLIVSCKLPVIIFGDHTKIFKYINFQFVAGADGIKVIKPSTLFDSNFFYYALKGTHLPDKGYARHFSLLKEQQIPLPPLLVQHKIVEILEEADNLRRLRRQADEKMKDLIPSLFVEMFGDPATNPKGWEVKRLGEVASIIMGQSPTGDSYNEKAFGKPLLNGPAEFGTKYPQTKKWTTNPTRLCKKDDILICVRGNTTGRMNIADTQYCIGRGLAAICSNQNMTINSVLYSFLSINADNILREATAGGSTFPNINIAQIENLPFPLPPLPLQKEFAKLVKEIEAEKARQEESGKKLYDLFNSLMQRAFKGELVA